MVKNGKSPTIYQKKSPSIYKRKSLAINKRKYLKTYNKGEKTTEITRSNGIVAGKGKS